MTATLDEAGQAGALSYGEIPQELLNEAASIVQEWEWSDDARGRAPARRIIMLTLQHLEASGRLLPAPRS